MRTQNSVTIRGEIGNIYSLAAKVERWPEILPHYRKVQVLESNGNDRLVSMQCVRSFGGLRWPCKWRAKQTLLPNENRILFRHIAGPVCGMEVEWRLQPSQNGVQTTIQHDLEAKNVWRRLFAAFVGPVFIHPIASQTLSTIKQLVERGDES